jgi:hypothetical protein
MAEVAVMLLLFRSLPQIMGSLALGQEPSPAATPISREQLFDHWKTLEAWDGVEGSYRTKVVVIRGERQSSSRVAVKMGPDRRILISTYEDKTGILAHSPLYAFAIARRSPNAGWSLKNFTRDSSPEARQAADVVPPLLTQCSYPLSMLSLVLEDEQFTMHGLAREPDFRIDHIIPNPNGFDRIEFVYKKISGYMLTDRRNASMVMQSQVCGLTEEGSQWVAEMKRELFPERSKDNRPRCKSIEYTFHDAHTHVIQDRCTLEFSDYSDEPIPDHEFRLSHYGLPEPIEGDISRPIPSHVWVLLAAAFFAAIGIGLGRRARRHGLKCGDLPGSRQNEHGLPFETARESVQ